MDTHATIAGKHDGYLPLLEAARYLGISRDKLWRMTKAGEIRSYVNPLNKRYRFYERQDLEKLKELRPTG